jgi:pentatricopeptide repeat protein
MAVQGAGGWPAADQKRTAPCPAAEPRARARGAQGIKPETRTYNTIMTACNRAGQPESAMGVYERMLGDGMQPTTSTYTGLITAWGKIGKVAAARPRPALPPAAPPCRPQPPASARPVVRKAAAAARARSLQTPTGRAGRRCRPFVPLQSERSALVAGSARPRAEPREER